MKRWNPKDLEDQFIDDLDPYEGEQSIPAPEATESHCAQVWQDFQDSQMPVTQPAPIAPERPH